MITQRSQYGRASMQNYDHRSNAGNAGDIWKHLVLTSLLDVLRMENRPLRIYVESHAGRPFYRVGESGTWQGGVGHCWPRRHLLRELPLFRLILKDNPNGPPPTIYRGSAGWILAMAQEANLPLEMHLWDVDPQVEIAWKALNLPWVIFHRSDGFLGVLDLLNQETTSPGILLIDPPYVDLDEDLHRAEVLFERATEAGWIALCWYMVNLERKPSPRKKAFAFELIFEEVGMDCGRWLGACVMCTELPPKIIERLGSRLIRFREILSS